MTRNAASRRNGSGETQRLPCVAVAAGGGTVTVILILDAPERSGRAAIETKRNETKRLAAAVVAIHVSRVRISGSFIFGGFLKEGHYGPRKSIMNRRPLSGRPSYTEHVYASCRTSGCRCRPVDATRRDGP